MRQCKAINRRKPAPLAECIFRYQLAAVNFYVGTIKGVGRIYQRPVAQFTCHGSGGQRPALCMTTENVANGTTGFRFAKEG